MGERLNSLVSKNQREKIRAAKHRSSSVVIQTVIDEECGQVSKCDTQGPGVIRVRKEEKGVEGGKKPTKINLRQQATQNVIKQRKKNHRIC